MNNFIEYGGVITSGSPHYSVWQHIAFTYKNGSASLLRNGRVVASSREMAPSNLWNILEISNIKGAIDELRIWSISKNVDEISDNMFVDVPTNSFGLELYYSFDHLKSYTGKVIDLSGNGRNAECTNMEYNPSYAMVQPIDTKIKSKVIDENNVSLTFEWKDSEVLPIINRAEAVNNNGIITTQTEYVVFLSNDVDFSTTFAGPFIINSQTFASELSGNLIDGYTYTPTGLYSASETIYCRILQSDVVTGNFPTKGSNKDSYDAISLAYSAYSNVSVLFNDTVQPGNMLSFSKHWPIYVDVTPKLDIDSTSGHMTVETWVKTTQSAPNVPLIATKQLSISSQSGFVLSLKNGQPSLNIGDGNKFTDFTINNLVNDGKWHHIAFVVNLGSNTVTGYVDGISKVATLNGVNPSGLTTASKMIIGQDLSTTHGDGFIGSLDEVRIFNSLRTTQQIKDYMIKSANFDDENLVLYYSFNQNSGNVVFDQSIVPTNGFVVGPTFDIWQQSNALSAAEPIEPVVSSNSFVAQWTASGSEYLKRYELVVSNNPTFDRSGTEYVQEINVGTATSYEVNIITDTEQTELIQPGKGYFYKVNTILSDPQDNSQEIILESVAKSLTTSISRDE
ncbi:MAG: LamG-like jellyroll fold domain-containing protein, partial [Lentisphaeria bacterium]